MLLIKLHCLIYVDYDLTAVLHDCILENPVLVFLGGVESYAKELSYRHHCQRCVVSDYHITLFEIIWSVMCTFPNRWQF